MMWSNGFDEGTLTGSHPKKRKAEDNSLFVNEMKENLAGNIPGIKITV